MSSNQQLDGTIKQDDNVSNMNDDRGDTAAAAAENIEVLKQNFRYVFISQMPQMKCVFGTSDMIYHTNRYIYNLHLAATIYTIPKVAA